MSAVTLARLALRYRVLREELAELRPRLEEAIRAERARGARPSAIATVSGLSRDTIHQMCLPPERRRSRARAG